VDVYRFPYLVGMVIPSLGRVKMAKLSERRLQKYSRLSRSGLGVGCR
jgi:hypothetical protein